MICGWECLNNSFNPTEKFSDTSVKLSLVLWHAIDTEITGLGGCTLFWRCVCLVFHIEDPDSQKENWPSSWISKLSIIFLCYKVNSKIWETGKKSPLTNKAMQKCCVWCLAHNNCSRKISFLPPILRMGSHSPSVTPTSGALNFQRWIIPKMKVSYSGGLHSMHFIISHPHTLPMVHVNTAGTKGKL